MSMPRHTGQGNEQPDGLALGRAGRRYDRELRCNLTHAAARYHANITQFIRQPLDFNAKRAEGNRE